MVQFYFPTQGRAADVPETDVDRASNEYGGVPVSDDGRVEMFFPDQNRYAKVPVAEVGLAQNQYGGLFRNTVNPTTDFMSSFPNWVGHEPANKQLLSSEKGKAYTELQKSMLAGKAGAASSSRAVQSRTISSARFVA